MTKNEKFKDLNKLKSQFTRLISNKYFGIGLEIILLLLAVYMVSIVNIANRKEIHEWRPKLDIWYEYLHSVDIVEGKNPYEKVLQYDLLTNQKYATLLPLYYYFLGAIAKSAQFDFETFADIYRNWLFVGEITAASFLYLIFRKQGQKILGFLAATFMMFNRWTISNMADGKQDILAIAFLMVSFYFLVDGMNIKYRLPNKKEDRKLMLAYLFFGLSMGIKHLSIFLAPIYLMPWILGRINFREFVINGLVFLIPTLGVSLPLLFRDPAALFYSMLFSFTREPSKLNTEFGYQELLVLYNVGVEKNNIFFYVLPRLPMVVFSGINFLLLVLKRIHIFVYGLAAMFIFIAFNPVLFSQYFTWIPPLLFLPALKISYKK